MSGCLDNAQCGECCSNLSCTCGLVDSDWLSERRNAISSILAGSLFAVGWWIAIDVGAVDSGHFNKAYWTCGVFGTLGLMMVNAVSNSQLRGDAYVPGALGTAGTRIWMVIGFLCSFGALIGASFILFGEYVYQKKHPSYPGTGFFMQNLLIFMATIIFKFGRVEDAY